MKLYFVDNRSLMPANNDAVDLMDTSRKNNQSMTARVKMNIDGYLHVHVHNMCNLTIKEMSNGKCASLNALGDWRSDVCVPLLRWRKNSFS
jgi:hypothetical protein